MGVAPIPFTSIAEYSKIYDVGDLDEFHYFIRRMDSTFLKLEDAKAKAKSKGS